MSELTTADRIALYGGGGLFALGVFLIGLFEMLAGAEHPVTGEGQIVHDAVIDVEIRAYIILAALLVWGLYVIYRVVATTPSVPEGDAA